VDTPGFPANKEEEQSKAGLLRAVPKVSYALCEAAVPQIVVHIGRNYGPARLIMGNLRMGADFAFSWLSAHVSRINPVEAVERM
jgi:acetyl-CoA carboxylase carboxyltransferase component